MGTSLGRPPRRCFANTIGIGRSASPLTPIRGRRPPVGYRSVTTAATPAALRSLTMVGVPARRSYPRHNWLPAIVPADARRFRVDDGRLAETLLDAGAEIVDGDADVAIGAAATRSGRAGVAIVPLEHVVA